MIDIDASIVTCRSDKQDAAGTWKRSFGFHPLLAISAPTCAGRLDLAASSATATQRGFAVVDV